MKLRGEGLSTRLSPKAKEFAYFPELLSTWKRLPPNKKHHFKSFESLEDPEDLLGKSVEKYLASLTGLSQLRREESRESTPAISSLRSPKSLHKRRTSIAPPPSFLMEFKYRKVLKMSPSPYSIMLGSLSSANNLVTLKSFNIRAILVVGNADNIVTHSFIRGYATVLLHDCSELNKATAAVDRFMKLHLQRGSVMLVGQDCNLCTLLVSCFLMQQFHKSAASMCNLAKTSNPGFRVSRAMYAEMKAMEGVMKGLKH
jgi:hypothetical protein